MALKGGHGQARWQAGCAPSELPPSWRNPFIILVDFWGFCLGLHGDLVRVGLAGPVWGLELGGPCARCGWAQGPQVCLGDAWEMLRRRRLQDLNGACLGAPC
ncbi:hypothetical protein NDU88_001735 [Pleurodeles waltl]|uniref:Uncharacterized protein n=1 Tax=Pleurodeles waltl TaxID=8319 RepID=A0AAV7VXA1_PLEWA|nr:hypothetical protein NDU88_001735 [Pleurodeles waltl]